jgi:hypothetical protein
VPFAAGWLTLEQPSKSMTGSIGPVAEFLIAPTATLVA